ncbi:hypothetical protein WME91_27325 [Sorangium sp. So ce269]
MTGFLRDARGHQSETLAFEAERAWKAGDRARALSLFAQAADLEYQVARDVPGEQPRVRGVLAISAVALWIDARRYDDAARAACEFLARPEMLTEQARSDLQMLLERAFREGALVKAIDNMTDAVPLEVKLAGGLVRAGIAPAALIRERQEVVTALVVRAAEWRMGRPFRKAGAARQVTDRIRFFEAPAAVASYGIRLFVASGGPAVLPGMEAESIGPEEAVAEFLAIAAAAQEGPEALRQHVDQEAYLKTFMVGFRDMAPDGATVGTVTFASPSWRSAVPPLAFEPIHRQRLTTGLLAQLRADERVEIEGTLKEVNLRARRPYIGVETADGDPARFFIKRGELDDTIGPKLNRRVLVSGIKRKKKDGTVVKDALDVVLLEGEPRDGSGG